jgi:hypothetical protein
MSTTIAKHEQKDISLLNAPADDAAAKIDDLTKEARLQIAMAHSTGNRIKKSLIVARTLRLMRDLVTDEVVEDLMELQSWTLGFLTDRDRPKNPGDKPGYPANVVRDVAIQTWLRGLNMVDNQVNIIAGRMYVTKVGMAELVKRIPGFKNLQIEPELPEYDKVRPVAYCGVVARWTMFGEVEELNCTKTDEGDFRIPVKVNAGMSDDAVMGKVTSKVLRRIYERISGLETPIVGDDQDDENTITSEVVEQVVPVEPKSLVIADSSVEAVSIPDVLLVDLDQALSAVVNVDQLNNLYQHWKSKLTNRGLPEGCQTALVERCKARKAELV